MQAGGDLLGQQHQSFGILCAALYLIPAVAQTLCRRRTQSEVREMLGERQKGAGQGSDRDEGSWRGRG